MRMIDGLRLPGRTACILIALRAWLISLIHPAARIRLGRDTLNALAWLTKRRNRPRVTHARRTQKSFSLSLLLRPRTRRNSAQARSRHLVEPFESLHVRALPVGTLSQRILSLDL